MEKVEGTETPDDWLGRIEFWVAAISLGIAAVLVFVSVALRYGFAYSISAFDELTRYSVILGTFAAASRLLHQDGHVTVDVLLINLPKKWRKRLQIAAYAAGAIFCALLIYAGTQFVFQSFQTGTRSMSNLRIPMWIPQSFVPLGALLLFVRFVQQIRKRLMDLESP